MKKTNKPKPRFTGRRPLKDCPLKVILDELRSRGVVSLMLDDEPDSGLETIVARTLQVAS